MSKNLAFFSYKSYLFTPALNVSHYHYAKEVGASACILDLEDSIPSTRKDEARRLVISFLKKKPDYPYALRINSIRTLDGLRDIEALIASGTRPDIIILPKVESPEEVILVNQWLSPKLGDIALCATIETIKGVQQLTAIVAVGGPLKLLLWGSADLTADVGVMLKWHGLYHVRCQLILAASQARIALIDTPEFDIEDKNNLLLEAKQSSQLGFTSKLAIHPSQVSIINHAFSLSKDQVLEAESVISQSQNSANSIFVLSGKMVGPPMIKAAEHILLRR